MDLKDIIKKYEENKNVRTLRTIIQHNQRNIIQLTGLAGSSVSVIAAACYKTNPHHAIFVLPDREEAAYFLNDIENLLGEKQVLFFPSSYKKSYHINDIDNNNVLLRAEVLSRISKSTQPFILVTYPEAINERVITKQNLANNTIEARVGDTLSIEFISEFLIANGFERTDFVFEPGQFAIRGGIVDVFSFANELPYRMEFGGDKIESIRSFDPNTQLSEKNLNHFTIIPNVQKELAQQGTESFFNFIPQDSVLWAKDLGFTMEYIQKNLDALKEKETVLNDDDEKVALNANDIYENEKEIEKHLQKFTLIEYGTKIFPDIHRDETLHFNHKPQPAFNKNFNLLSENFLSNLSRGYKNIIFSDTAKQIERIYAIFEDIHFKSSSVKTQTMAPGQKIEFSPILLSLHEGFIDNDLQLACYTDHQIFDRYHRFRLRKTYSRSEALTLKELYSLKPGDFITHIDHGVGRFGGLEKIEVNGKQQEAIRLVYK
ncbi:MAG: CarD family transcriptional regulator, partial [Bacteroidia bacterium]